MSDATTNEELGPEEFPIPYGIEASTGRPIPGLTEADLARVEDDPEGVSGRSGVRMPLRAPAPSAFEAAISDVNVDRLEEAGWCVVFAKDADPAIREALQPLLDHRRAQIEAGLKKSESDIKVEQLYKEFTGAGAVQPGEDARRWIERHGAGLALVDPLQGIPVYVLLVGSPQQIPFEFQYLLDLYWNVGRIHFDTAAEYRRYAERVVVYETAAAVAHKKRLVMFSVKNGGDRATALLMRQVTQPLLNGTSTGRKLDKVNGFRVEGVLNEEATKARLLKLLSGQDGGGVPALLFTGSHGVRFDMTDPLQRDKQGAILCQDWPGFDAVQPEHVFTAHDLPEGAPLDGLIHFFFACYGGGCPVLDNFGVEEGEAPKQLMSEPVVARLPQRMLLNGALATIAHIDRAWAFSFQNTRGAALVQNFREVLVNLMKGQRVGAAVDQFNMRWAVLAADLSEAQNANAPSNASATTKARLANTLVARNDARNYVVLGDPAVRLRVGEMAAA